MEKYKLIKEHPGSPVLGHEIEYPSTEISFNPADYPDYWERIRPDAEEIMRECIKRFPKGSKVRSPQDGYIYKVRTTDWPKHKTDSYWREGVYYFDAGHKGVLAMAEGKTLGFYLYHNGVYGEVVSEPLFIAADGEMIFEGGHGVGCQ